jgi:hypothetical protein
VLLDDAQVATYYLGDAVYPTRWVNTFFLSYYDHAAGRSVTGPRAYADAIRDGYFDVIAIDFGAQKSVDAAVAEAVHLNKQYHYVTKVDLHDVYGTVTYVIWRKQ